MGEGIFLQRGDAGADPDRPGPVAPLPARTQQELELCGGSARQGCLRAQFRQGHRAGAARAAAHHPATAGNQRLRARLRVPFFHPARACRRTVRRHGSAELPPVPRHAQQQPVRGRRRSQEPAHQLAGRIAAPPFRQRGAAGGDRQLLAAGGRVSAAAIRTGAG